MTVNDFMVFLESEAPKIAAEINSFRQAYPEQVRQYLNMVTGLDILPSEKIGESLDKYAEAIRNLDHGNHTAP